nr:unnamed protein product [Callosobruchus analis]
MRLQSLVTKPLISYKDLVGKNGSLQSHENHLYHKRAVQPAEHFIKFYHDPNRDVANQLDKKRLVEIEDNRNRPPSSWDDKIYHLEGIERRKPLQALYSE